MQCFLLLIAFQIHSALSATLLLFAYHLYFCEETARSVSLCTRTYKVVPILPQRCKSAAFLEEHSK